MRATCAVNAATTSVAALSLPYLRAGGALALPPGAGFLPSSSTPRRLRREDKAPHGGRQRLLNVLDEALLLVSDD